LVKNKKTTSSVAGRLAYRLAIDCGAKLLQWIEKNKSTPERTYTERLRDMGRDPSIPGSPIIKNTPPTKGMSGGAGFTPGTINPFNPDSPLNR
jgi:hypothetical protein